MSPQQAIQYTLPEKTDQNTLVTLCNNIPLLNSVKILAVRSVENFKPTSIWSDCRPAVRPTSTRSMAPDFSHNKGNHVRFTKQLFQKLYYGTKQIVLHT